MNEKLKWILETWFDGFHCRLLEKAINSKEISLDEFISGFDAIREKQIERDEDIETFVPDEFEEL